MSDINRLLQRLSDAEIDFVIVGGIEVELFGRRCRVISLDDLIRAKEALTRDKDHQTVLQLRAIREKLAAAAAKPPTSE